MLTGRDQALGDRARSVDRRGLDQAVDEVDERGLGNEPAAANLHREQMPTGHLLVDLRSAQPVRTTISLMLFKRTMSDMCPFPSGAGAQCVPECSCNRALVFCNDMWTTLALCAGMMVFSSYNLLD
jgi:hypothetical protein